jgi:hypothetical protein
MPAVYPPVVRRVCQICGRPQSRAELLPAPLVRGSLAARIRSTFPSWLQECFICRDDLNRFRAEYVHFMLAGELTFLGHSSALRGEGEVRVGRT